MHNYKALKSASKVSVQKVKVVDRAERDTVLEVLYKDGDDIPEGKLIGDVKVHRQYALPEKSHEELQVVCKKYDPDTGEVKDDSVTAYSLLEVKREIDRRKSEIARAQAEQAEWEQLETDLKAL
jgi:hypothetical protein